MRRLINIQNPGRSEHWLQETDLKVPEDSRRQPGRHCFWAAEGKRKGRSPLETV